LDVRAKFEVTHAFVLDAAAVRKIWVQVGQGCQVIEATARCTDDIIRKFNSATELSDYENAERAQIRSLTISGRSEDYKTNVEISFADRYGAMISFDMRGSESTIIPLKSNLADISAGLKPWYSKLATFQTGWLWGAFSLLCLLFTISTPTPAATPFSIKKYLFMAAIVVTVIALAMATDWLSGKIRRYCFPRAFFSFGQGCARYDVAEKYRWGVIVALFVGFATSIISLPLTLL